MLGFSLEGGLLLRFTLSWGYTPVNQFSADAFSAKGDRLGQLASMMKSLRA
ncbi:MAG: hypothetical protein ACK58N_12940 [Synechocystis sp.]